MSELLKKQVTYWKNCFEEIGFKYKKLEKQNASLCSALRFVVRNSGSSTNYNKRAREALNKLKDLEQRSL